MNLYLIRCNGPNRGRTQSTGFLQKHITNREICHNAGVVEYMHILIRQSQFYVLILRVGIENYC